MSGTVTNSKRFAPALPKAITSVSMAVTVVCGVSPAWKLFGDRRQTQNGLTCNLRHLAPLLPLAFSQRILSKAFNHLGRQSLKICLKRLRIGWQPHNRVLACEYFRAHNILKLRNLMKCLSQAEIFKILSSPSSRLRRMVFLAVHWQDDGGQRNGQPQGAPPRDEQAGDV